MGKKINKNIAVTLGYFWKGKQEDTGDHRPVNRIVVWSKLSD